jgi:cob(I)alamin adenosyltransferase
MKLYTKTGDGGETSLFDGSRVPKSHHRVSTYGDVDELNAQIGLARSFAESDGSGPRVRAIDEFLRAVQADLFSIGAELATPQQGSHRVRAASVTEDDISRLERWIDEADEQVPPLRNFILPAGSALTAQLHVCRTVCRRAERNIVHLAASEPVSNRVIVYLNRLSDLLFAWSRVATLSAGRSEEPWQPRRDSNPSESS